MIALLASGKNYERRDQLQTVKEEEEEEDRSKRQGC